MLKSMDELESVVSPLNNSSLSDKYISSLAVLRIQIPILKNKIHGSGSKG